jgi:hypothetical protein
LADPDARAILAGDDGPATGWWMRTRPGREAAVVAIRAGLAVIVLVSLASCEPGESGQASMTGFRDATATTDRMATTTTSAPTVDPDRGFSTERVVFQEPGPDDPRASSLFKQVRFSGNQGYDRAVFEFERGMPYGGFYVEYGRGPDGLGDAGCVAPERQKGADLVVSLHGTGTAEGVDPGSGRRSYTGRERVRPTSTNEIMEAVLYCEFEATVEWVLVLRARQPFRVTTLTDPPRIVIDVERRPS